MSDEYVYTRDERVVIRAFLKATGLSDGTPSMQAMMHGMLLAFRHPEYARALVASAERSAGFPFPSEAFDALVEAWPMERVAE